MLDAYVLLFDLVGSSGLADRQAATDAVQSAQARLNRSFAEHFLAPLETTRGDETAAVLAGPAAAYDLIAEFGDLISPLRLRAVVHHGSLVTGLDSRRASIIDGPAFHAADAQMDALKEGPALCQFDLGLADLDPTLDALGNLLLTHLDDLTELQRRILRGYQRRRGGGDGATQEAVAEAVGTTQQNVSRTLKGIRWELLEAGEVEMRRLLARAADRRGQPGMSTGRDR